MVTVLFVQLSSCTGSGSGSEFASHRGEQVERAERAGWRESALVKQVAAVVAFVAVVTVTQSTQEFSG